MMLELAVLCAVFAQPEFYLSESRQRSTCEILPEVLENAERNDIDPFLLMGLITVESNWNPKAESWAGACGLTQVMPQYTGGAATKGIKYTCESLKRPKTGVKAGSDILSWWVKSYGKGHIPTGLCGYYSGFRCKPQINKAGERYYKKVLKQESKIKKAYQKALARFGDPLRYPERTGND